MGLILVHDCSRFARFGKAVCRKTSGLRPGVFLTPRRKTTGLRPGIVRKVDNNGRSRAAHDYPSKRLLFRRVDFHVREVSGDMNEIAGLCTRDRFTSFAPADLADAGEDGGDRPLLPLIVNP